MKAVVQRVIQASVSINNELTSKIKVGLVVLLGISSTDSVATAEWMADKIAGLRVFSDKLGKMNISVSDMNGDILVVSNFTLYGDVQKGFRPSFASAAPSEEAKPIYDYFLDYLRRSHSNLHIASGEFGAMMHVDLTNDGPVTILLEK